MLISPVKQYVPRFQMLSIGVIEVASAVKYQGQFGSCRAFSATQALLSQVALTSGGFRVGMVAGLRVPSFLSTFAGLAFSLIHPVRAPGGFHVPLASGSPFSVSASPKELRKIGFSGLWLHGHVSVFSAQLGPSVIHAHASVYGVGGFPRDSA